MIRVVTIQDLDSTAYVTLAIYFHRQDKWSCFAASRSRRSRAPTTVTILVCPIPLSGVTVGRRTRDRKVADSTPGRSQLDQLSLPSLPGR